MSVSILARPFFADQGVQGMLIMAGGVTLEQRGNVSEGSDVV